MNVDSAWWTGAIIVAAWLAAKSAEKPKMGVVNYVADTGQVLSLHQPEGGRNVRIENIKFEPISKPASKPTAACKCEDCQCDPCECRMPVTDDPLAVPVVDEYSSSPARVAPSGSQAAPPPSAAVKPTAEPKFTQPQQAEPVSVEPTNEYQDQPRRRGLFRGRFRRGASTSSSGSAACMT